MTVSYVEENLLQISRPAIYRQADSVTTPTLTSPKSAPALLFLW